MSRGGGGRGGFVEGKVYVGGLPEDATSEEVSLNYQIKH